MNINNYQNFLYNTKNKELLALDISKKRIGMAISNKETNLALPLKTILRTKFITDAQTITNTYNEYKCGGLIIGYPINLDNTLGKRCQSIRGFTRELLKYLNVPIYFENEQFSTFAIKDFYKTHNLKMKKLIDANAAAYFLQNFLNRLNTIKIT